MDKNYLPPQTRSAWIAERKAQIYFEMNGLWRDYRTTENFMNIEASRAIRVALNELESERQSLS